MHTKMLVVFSDIIILGEKCHESHEGTFSYKEKGGWEVGEGITVGEYHQCLLYAHKQLSS